MLSPSPVKAIKENVWSGEELLPGFIKDFLHGLLHVTHVPYHCVPVWSMLQLTVEDADHGPNSQVTFSVNSDRFAVNSSTGILYTTQPLDREEQPHYHLTVQATDGGGEAAKVTDR